MNLPIDDPLAVAVMRAIQEGHVSELRQILDEHTNLPTSRIVDAAGVQRTLLLVASDWPGHFPNVAETIEVLIGAGVEVNAVVVHPDPTKPPETPLHWAASSNDVAAIDALLDGGANIEATGGVFTGGTAMSDAVVFANWDAAKRLLERGAKTTMWQAAGLGRVDLVETHCESNPPTPEAATSAFWTACMAGQKSTAECLSNRGADLNWIGYDDKTPLDVAIESGAEDLVAWLRQQGAMPAVELPSPNST